MPPFRRHLASLLVITPLLGASFALPVARPVAWAAPSAEAQARTLFQKAEVHFNLGEFDQALALYSEAYRLKPLPGFLFNIAQCHRFMEHFEDAAFSFRVYLDRAPHASNRAEVEALVAQMEREAAARARPAPTLSPGVSAAQPVVAAPTAVPPDPTPPPSSVTRSTSDWFWPALGGGAALLGAGLVTGQMASTRSDSYRDPETPVAERRSLKDSGETLATVSMVCLGAAGLALAAAAGLWYWAPRATESTQVAATPVVGGAALTLRRAF